MNLRVRRADPTDARPLTNCVTAAYAVAQAQGVDLPPVAEGLAEDIRDHLVWVAEFGPDLVGGIVVRLADDHAHLANIAVDPNRGGQGVGRALIDMAIADLVAREVTRFDLTTHVDMPWNVALYRHLGWALTGQDGKRVHMSRKIG